MVAFGFVECNLFCKLVLLIDILYRFAPFYVRLRIEISSMLDLN